MTKNKDQRRLKKLRDFGLMDQNVYNKVSEDISEKLREENAEKDKKINELIARIPRSELFSAFPNLISNV